MNPVITVDGLAKSYGAVTAVAELSFSVERGEIFGILGPNGAGKTTTVECLQGLRHRDGGEVRVLGLDPDRQPDELRRRIGSQLQSSALPDRLRVSEAVQLFAGLQAVQVDVAEALETWGLTELRRRPFAALSGGQRQRLFLALALLGEPEVVFLDELTTGLDPQARRTAWDLVRSVRDRGATIVLVTHLMEEAEELCDRVAVVDRGHVVALDRPRRLTAELGGPVEVTFTSNGTDPALLEGIFDGLDGVSGWLVRDGLAHVTGESSAVVGLACALADHDLHPDDFTTHRPSLEDVFLALTGHTLRN